MSIREAWAQWRENDTNGEPNELYLRETTYGAPVRWQWGITVTPTSWGLGVEADHYESTREVPTIESPHRRHLCLRVGPFAAYVTHESSSGQSEYDLRRQAVDIPVIAG